MTLNPNEPQLEFVFRVDLQRSLQSTWAALDGLAGAMPDEGVQIYRAGFLAALQAVGLAVGVDWQDTPTPTRAARDWGKPTPPTNVPRLLTGRY
ncbi:MAG: hypothetical protein KJZ86_13710 [Caldilineaceae bacterium]|nr:hypothetical protein [Caldilineaceae bacterium]HRJ40768.1 hypothetical protein [Caldilineaceae bacterium]